MNELEIENSSVYHPEWYNNSFESEVEYLKAQTKYF